MKTNKKIFFGVSTLLIIGGVMLLIFTFAVPSRPSVETRYLRTYLEEPGCETFTIADIRPGVTISPATDKVAIVLSTEDCERMTGARYAESVVIDYCRISLSDDTTKVGRILIKIVRADRMINGTIDVHRLSKLYLDIDIQTNTSQVQIDGTKEDVGIVIAWLPPCSTNFYCCQYTKNIVTGGLMSNNYIFTGDFVDKIYGGNQRDFIFSGTGSLDYINGGVTLEDARWSDSYTDVAITSAPDSRVVNVERILRW